MYSKEQIKDLCEFLDAEYKSFSIPSDALVPLVCSHALRYSNYDFESFTSKTSNYRSIQAASLKLVEILNMDINQLPLYINSPKIEERLVAKWRLSKGI